MSVRAILFSLFPTLLLFWLSFTWCRRLVSNFFRIYYNHYISFIIWDFIILSCLPSVVIKELLFILLENSAGIMLWGMWGVRWGGGGGALVWNWEVWSSHVGAQIGALILMRMVFKSEMIIIKILSWRRLGYNLGLKKSRTKTTFRPQNNILVHFRSSFQTFWRFNPSLLYRSSTSPLGLNARYRKRPKWPILFEILLA